MAHTPASTGRSALGSDQRGAVMIMGIPMMFLLIGMVFYVAGIGDALVMRERLQDAADTAALSAAIMHARGMNLIVLVNQVMAAMVALLVMVRTLQVLMVAVGVIAAALAWPTFGASLAVVPPAAEGAELAEEAYNELKNVIDPVLEALHVLELGIKYGMTPAAQLMVIEQVRTHYRPPADIGFVIPGSYPLPVVEGEWPDLCREAGEYAGQMIGLPVTAIIGDNVVTEYISDGMGALTSSFSKLFCDPSGSVEGISIPTTLPEIPLDHSFNKGRPQTAASIECAKVQPSAHQAGESADAREADRRDEREGKQAICHKAAQDEALAAPDGGDGGPNTKCEYKDAQQNPVYCDPCRPKVIPPGEGEETACTEFVTRVDAAASECDPYAAANAELDVWTYQLADLRWRANLVPVPLPPAAAIPTPDDRRYTVKFETERPQVAFSNQPERPAPPCGSRGTIAKGYNRSARYRPDRQYGDGDFLCYQPHLHPDPSAWAADAGQQGLPFSEWLARFNNPDGPPWVQDEEVYEPPRPTDWDEGVQGRWPPPNGGRVPRTRPFFVGNWQAVTYLSGCGETIGSLDDLPIPETLHPPVEREGEPQECGQGEKIHHQMEPGLKLGSETFQQRAVVISGSLERKYRRFVRKVPKRLGRDQNADGGFWETASDVASTVFVAQAEYYFDATFEKGEVTPGLDQWHWLAHWRARLRRFRLPYDSSDDEEDGGISSSAGQGGGGAQGGGDDLTGCDIAEVEIDVGDACDQAQEESDGGASGEQACSDPGFFSGLGEFADALIVH